MATICSVSETNTGRNEIQAHLVETGVDGTETVTDGTAFLVGGRPATPNHVTIVVQNCTPTTTS